MVEYEIKSLYDLVGIPQPDPLVVPLVTTEQIGEAMNKQGEDGWQLCGVIGTGPYSSFIFSRTYDRLIVSDPHSAKAGPR